MQLKRVLLIDRKLVEVEVAEDGEKPILILDDEKENGETLATMGIIDLKGDG